MASPDFSQKTVEALAKRAAQTCSNSSCQKPTSGPHSDASKSVIKGEAAHIRGARPGSARYDPAMSDEERGRPVNGIWLCRECAKVIDGDESRFPVTLLEAWKRTHEGWVDAGRPTAPPVREVFVTDGGIGAVIANEGSGTALEVVAPPGQTAERVHVHGKGIGEIIVNSGSGTAKVTRATNATASESSVTIDRPVRMAAGLISKVSLLKCSHCGAQFTASKVVQGFAGDQEPSVQVKCPQCGGSMWI
jgi:hypothetical protein